MNTMFLRLESHMQSYPMAERYEFVMTSGWPTKSAVIGMIAAAFGIRRGKSRGPLAELNRLLMGVRIDRPGEYLEDFQMCRAPLIMAEGGIKTSGEGKAKKATGKYTIRTYLTNASFLVVLQGDDGLITEAAKAVRDPNFPLYLGRRSCIPYRNPFDGTGDYASLEHAMEDRTAVGWTPCHRIAVLERTVPTENTFVSFDVLHNCDPFVHGGRLVEKVKVAVTPSNVPLASLLLPDRERYSRSDTPHSRKVKKERMEKDKWLCLVCKMGAKHSHHVTYIRYGEEDIEDLRSLCEACHAATTKMEYDGNMVELRIDPLDPYWRGKILSMRKHYI